MNEKRNTIDYRMHADAWRAAAAAQALTGDGFQKVLKALAGVKGSTVLERMESVTDLYLVRVLGPYSDDYLKKGAKALMPYEDEYIPMEEYRRVLAALGDAMERLDAAVEEIRRLRGTDGSPWEARTDGDAAWDGRA